MWEYCHWTVSSKRTVMRSSGAGATVDGLGSAVRRRGWAPAAGATTTMAVAAIAATAINRGASSTLMGAG